MPEQREIFWNIHGVWLFYLLSFISVSIFFYGILKHILFWKKGIKQRLFPPLLTLLKGIKDTLIDGIFARRILKGDIGAGVTHLFIFWGFSMLFLGTVLLAIDHYVLPFLKGKPYIVFSFCLEISGIMLIFGLFFAIFRRYIQKVKRLENRKEDIIILLWLILLAITGFLLEGIRLSYNSPIWERYSFFGLIVSTLFPKNIAPEIYPFFWWFHAIAALSFISVIPFTKLFHIFGSPLSIYLKDANEIASVEEKEGLFFYFKDLLQIDTCTRCGRCVEICPSNGVGEPFSPRDVLFGLKESLFYNKQVESVERLSWYCTTCGACLQVCPIYIAPFQIIRGLRSREIEDGTRVPSLIVQSLERLYKYNNPWISTKKRRDEWAKDMDIVDITRSDEEVLLCYFVGCTTSHDTRAQQIAKAFSSILKICNIRFGILGKKEPCCGDIARRLGEDGLFEDQAEQCLSLFEQYGIKSIITSSPHCFYTMSREYPLLKKESRISVMHYSMLLESLINEGRLKFEKELRLKVTYHDPCYLGRHSKIFDSPRNVINSIAGIELKEMEHSRENSLCCGGGGGRMWQEELDVELKMSERRIMEAYDTGAEVVVTCCPLCLIMLEDARKSRGLEDSIKVMDLNELVLMAINRRQS